MSNDPWSPQGADSTRSQYVPGPLASGEPAEWTATTIHAGATYARFWRRFAASIIDGLLFGTSMLLIAVILDAIGFAWATDSFFDVDALDGTLIWLLTGTLFQESLIALVAGWMYNAGLQSSHWQATIGKRAVGIVVTDLAGNRISFARATGRHFAEYLSGILLAGYLIQPFTEKRQTLHDLIAGTLVVKR